MNEFKFDSIGYWSEVKLDILKDYAQAYSRILTSNKLHHVYIDAFAGAGLHFSRRKSEPVAGSPLNALLIKPPFEEFHFIDLDSGKADQLRQIAAGHSNAHVHEGDCNEILLTRVFPGVKYDQYRRGLCLLDPYGLHLSWRVIEAAGRLRTIDMFLNFPVQDMNRNVLWKDSNAVSPEQADRMTNYWGDESWKKVAYDSSGNLFGWEEKQPNEVIAAAFQDRLRNKAGFKHVSEPMPMRNSKGAVVDYLFFASAKPVAKEIVEAIFKKYRRRGAA